MHAHQTYVTNEILDMYNLAERDNLMIIAHPDDETLFGGAELLEKGHRYFVVCLTNLNNATRRGEFTAAMQHYGAAFLMLGHSDGKLNDCESYATADIETIVNYKEWTRIVTHNLAGEYGHFDHVLCAKMVQNRVQNARFTPVFGTFFYTFSPQNTDLNPDLTPENLAKLNEILSIYASQSYAINKYKFIVPFQKVIITA
jgi:LmbE family N-acetylglucosaminyl deacetylase